MSDLRHRNKLLGFAGFALVGIATASGEMPEKALLGQALFFDTNLSWNRTQACATCHEPGRAFSDGRDNKVGSAMSLGDDGVSLGERNTPSIMYANQIPERHVNKNGEYVGGYFLDGRAPTMEHQASEPFLNPKEMAMPDRAAVVHRIRENSEYVRTMQEIFGQDVFADDVTAFDAIVESIVAFEKGPQFAPFDSKYDRFLRGEYEMTAEEETGRLLFFSQMIGCHNCHLLDARESSTGELFTNHKYHNIGVPANVELNDLTGMAQIDHGLLQNPLVTDVAQDGKFRVPSLRNVAVTAPYMHNGVFRNLETAVLFYDKYLVRDRQAATNPESGKPWGEPEVSATVDLPLLRQGQPVTEERVGALVAFLRTLTDKRYEPLLD